jgi:hypothetical protein
MAGQASSQWATKPKPASPAPAARAIQLGARAHKLASTEAMLNGSARVQALRRTAQRVVQRSVLHKIIDDKTCFYSDLEKGKPHYETREEAEEVDKKLSADPAAIKHALYRKDGTTPKRANTPYSYARAGVHAAPSSRDQGPHTVGFGATEYRLQQRLNKNHIGEIAKQVPSPLEFQLSLADLGSDAGIDEEKALRMRMDYISLHDEYQTMLDDGSEPKTKGSRFHLVVRKLMQMHPATTYGKNVKSSGHGERSNSRFGSHVLDEGAKSKFPKQDKLEDYYNMREDMFHSSDDESGREDFEPYEYKHIKPRTKEERRARRGKPYARPKELVHEKPELDDKLEKKVKTE